MSRAGRRWFARRARSAYARPTAGACWSPRGRARSRSGPGSPLLSTQCAKLSHHEPAGRRDRLGRGRGPGRIGDALGIRQARPPRGPGAGIQALAGVRAADRFRSPFRGVRLRLGLLARIGALAFIVWHRSLKGNIAYGPYLAAGALLGLYFLPLP